MTVANRFKSEFIIDCYDHDLVRGEKLGELMRSNGYDFNQFNSRGFFSEAMDRRLPHIVILYYQPLSLKFHDLLQMIRKKSSETEVVVLGAQDYWPGIHSLMKTGLVDDFWVWPFADEEVFQLRINQIIQRKVFQFIAEQRRGETQKIVQKLMDVQLDKGEGVEPTAGVQDFSALSSPSFNNSAQVLDALMLQFKRDFPLSDFIYLGHYQPKNQLISMRSSFAKESASRGQVFDFSLQDYQLQKEAVVEPLTEQLKAHFNCENISLQAVEFGQVFFGFILANRFEESAYLQKTAKYLALSLRRVALENEGKRPEQSTQLSRVLDSASFDLTLSNELSRARHLNQPLSLVIGHIEFLESDAHERDQVIKAMEDQLRGFDFLCCLDKNRVALIYPHTTFKEAAIKAENFRRQIVARGLKSQRTPLRLCFGVSAFPDLSADTHSLIEDAGKACDQVLVSGKNKVCLFSPERDVVPSSQVDAQI